MGESGDRDAIMCEGPYMSSKGLGLGSGICHRNGQEKGVCYGLD